MNKLRYRLVGLIIILAGVGLSVLGSGGLGPRAYANITLIDFNAYSASGQPLVFVSWETGTELNTLGFYVLRASSSSGPWDNTARVSDFIPGEGDTVTGAAYDWTDSGVVVNTWYYYRLEEITASQSSITYPATAIAVLAGVAPTATPTRTSTPTATSTASATPTRTPTSTADSTSQPAATSTAQPAVSGASPTPRIISGSTVTPRPAVPVSSGNDTARPATSAAGAAAGATTIMTILPAAESLTTPVATPAPNDMLPNAAASVAVMAQPDAVGAPINVPIGTLSPDNVVVVAEPASADDVSGVSNAFVWLLIILAAMLLLAGGYAFIRQARK
jgi:hypothetical protein